MITIVLFTCLIALSLRYLLQKQNTRFYQLLEHFPSYPTYPLIGNLYKLYGPQDDNIGKMEKIMEPYDRLLFWIGPIPTIMLKKYDDIMTVTNQCHDRDFHDFLKPWTDVGIVTARYDEWKKSRKMLSPAFSSQMLTKYVEVFNEKASILADQFRSVVDTDEMVDIWDIVVNANMNTALENIMGVSCEEKNNGGFTQVWMKALQNMSKRISTPWLHSRFALWIYLNITGKIKLVEYVNEFPTKIIKDTLHDIRNGNEPVHSSKTVIDLLVKKSLTDDITETRMKDEVLQLIATGMETSALNVSFSLLMLAIHQDVQQKVYQEIKRLTPNDAPLTFDQLTNDLKYLEQCIRETGRMYTASIVTLRYTHKECALHDNKIIPAGTNVLLHLHLSHYDKDLYENPRNWDPQHFSEQAVAKRPKGSDLLFGFGARSCIGYKYALLSIKTQLVHILRRYHLSTDIRELTADNLKSDLMVRSKIGYPIRFVSRQKFPGF
uniref:Cytochrome P450 4461P2 n=1 Tax=Maconellicoccus hirsutus TaxID=177089 RepID=A0AAT9UTW6_MACHI